MTEESGNSGGSLGIGQLRSHEFTRPPRGPEKKGLPDRVSASCQSVTIVRSSPPLIVTGLYGGSLWLLYQRAHTRR